MTAGFKPLDDNLVRTRNPKYWSWESPKQPITRCEYYKYQQKKRKQKKRNRKIREDTKMIEKYAIFVSNDCDGEMEQYTIWLTKESVIEKYKSMSKYLLLRDNARVMILKQVDPETGE